MKDEALKLALEALESCDFVYTFGNGGYQQFDRPSVEKAITAIKQACSAQHEPENEPFVSMASVQEPVQDENLYDLAEKADNGGQP